MRAALERYFNEVCGAGRTSRDAILASGLIGCREAEADLSTSYKARLLPCVNGGGMKVSLTVLRDIAAQDEEAR